MEISMEKIRPGDRVVVTRIPDVNPIKSRLAEFGLVPETEIHCRFLSPGGDLAALELLGTVIAVRRADLCGITARRHP